MLTDRAPFEYRYLSRRLLTDLFRHDEAARSRWRGSAGINLPVGASLQFQRSDLDKTNLRALANQSSQLVSDHTGDLATPGPYVSGQLELHYGVFEPHMGWTGGKVACYRGESSEGDGTKVFLALFGSASNVVGRRDRDEVGDGYYPSDIHGIYTILDAAREDDDPQIDFEYRWDDAQMSENARVHTAIGFARGGARLALGLQDFLARVFLKVEGYRDGPDFTGRVIIGTPLWIATPRPQPFHSGTAR